jgi:hypothetical protein
MLPIQRLPADPADAAVESRRPDGPERTGVTASMRSGFMWAVFVM